MLPDKEFDRLDDALKVVLEQGAKRVSYGVEECIHPESSIRFTSRSYCFEKECQIPISDELKRLRHPGTIPVTCSISKVDGESKWQLSQWIKGTGGSIAIDSMRPGVALGSAFIEYDLQQISWKKRSFFSSLQEQQFITDYMSEGLLSQWNNGCFERMFRSNHE